MRNITLGLLAAVMVAIGAPTAQAGVTCMWVKAMCPAPGGPGSDPDGHHHSVPEPGTLGLLAMGAAASIGMLRRRKR